VKKSQMVFLFQVMPQSSPTLCAGRIQPVGTLAALNALQTSLKKGIGDEKMSKHCLQINLIFAVKQKPEIT
jgi:hypothetical protein